MTSPTPSAQNPPSPSRVIRLIHGGFVVGLFVMTIVVGFVVQATPIDQPNFAAFVVLFCLADMGVALTIMRKKIPCRGAESPDAFWGRREVPPKALVFWALIEGAGLLGAVGHLLTRKPETAAMAILALVLLLLFRPSRFEAAN